MALHRKQLAWVKFSWLIEDQVLANCPKDYAPPRIPAHVDISQAW